MFAGDTLRAEILKKRRFVVFKSWTHSVRLTFLNVFDLASFSATETLAEILNLQISNRGSILNSFVLKIKQYEIIFMIKNFMIS